jgi:hypothetical protein
MTRKIYKSAMGKTVDLGALLLQNEQVRAVGNMGVNAAGDLVDSTNRVIDQRNRQVQRQYRRQTNVSNTPIATSNLSAKKMEPIIENEMFLDSELDMISDPATGSIAEPNPVEDPSVPAAGGLAAAIARNREIKQELEKTRKQQLQDQGVKKI